MEKLASLTGLHSLFVGLGFRGNHFICPASKVTEPFPLPGVMLTCAQMYLVKGRPLDHYWQMELEKDM